MTYELATFDELVYGSLSPFYTLGTDRNKQITFLNQHFKSANRIKVGHFKKDKNQIALQSLSILYCIHPAAKNFINDQLHLFQETELELIDQQIIKELELEQSQIQKVLHQNQLRKLSIGVLEQSQWESLDNANLKFYYYCGILQLEKEQLISKIKNKVHQLNTREEIEQYIHKHQQGLISLCIKLLNQSNFEKNKSCCSIKNTYNDQDILNLIYYFLEKILRFIETKYPGYIDQNITIPFKSKLIEENNIIQKSEQLKSMILESNLNSKLTSIILSPTFKLNNFNSQGRLTYKELIYYNNYFDQFLLDLQGEEPITEHKVIRSFFHVNYNNPELLHYLFNQINSTLRELETHTLQLDYLYKILKETNQHTICAHIAFAPLEPNLKVQLSAWLEEEIQYINKAQSIAKESNQLTINGARNSPGKFQSDLSVNELALLFRLLHDTDVIAHQNQSEIIQFVAENFSSKKSENISSSSLRTKYYSPENMTIEKVTNQLKMMLEQLKKY